MAGCSEVPNCTVPDNGTVSFAADPDIGGYGVVIAFVASAWLNYFFVVLAYMFIRDGISDDQMNNLDRMFTGWTKRLPRWLSKSLPYLASKHISREAVQQVVLMLSDQQLITGASILIIGYAKHCTITQYHFNIITLLGWISFTSHQPTLMILQEYLIPRPSMRHWRAIWISGLMGMVGTALVVIYNNDFLDTYGMSTQCVWDNIRNNYSWQWLIQLVVNSFVLLWGYLAAMNLLFPSKLSWMITINSWFQKVFRMPSRIYNKSKIKLANEKALLMNLWNPWKVAALSTSHPSLKAIYHLSAAAISWLIWLAISGFTFLAFFLVLTFSEICYSVTLDLFRIYASLLWATTLLLTLRNGAAENGMEGDESDWGFGQLLPLLLLILPVLAAWEIIYDELVISKPQRLTSSVSADQMPVMLPERYLSAEPSSSSIDITDATISTRLNNRFLLRRARPDTEARIALETIEAEGIGESSEEQRSLINNNASVFSLEDAMYRYWLFKLWMLVLVCGSFVGVTVGALKGYTF